MTTMVNNWQCHIVHNMSHTYCLQVTKFHCNILIGLRAAEESSARGGGTFRPDRVKAVLKVQRSIENT